MKTLRKLICVVLAFVLVVGLLPVANAAELPFKDVAADSWYGEAVKFVYNNKLMNGTADTAFSPDTNMSRAMIVTVLHRLEGTPDASAKIPFKDVKADQYYYDSVVWSYENGIVNGTSDTTFSPDTNVTREQLVTIFYRFANSKEYDTSKQANLSGYSDANKISDYAKNALSWAVAEGIVNGTSDTTLSPAGNATRAQFAAIMQRFTLWAAEQRVKPEPTQPSTEATEPTTEATEPSTEATEPTTEATEPTTEATEPTTEATEPSAEATQPAEDVQVAEPMDYSYMAEIPTNAVQDIRYFTNHQVEVDGKPGDTYCEYKSLSDEIIEAYVAMLEENGFTLVEAYSDSFMGGNKYMSWGLTYDLDPTLDTMGQQFADGQCHLCIWKSKSSYGWTYRIDNVEGLVMQDLGLRMDGSTVDIAPQGPSVGAGLLRLSDGSYQTDDGRLTAAVGSAVVVRDGVGLEATAAFERDASDQKITISGYQLDEQILFEADNDVMVHDTLLRNYELEPKDITFSLTVDGEKRGQNYNSDTFEAISVRVMYYEPEGDAVFYIYAKTNGEPAEIEALCAVSTAPEEKEPLPDIPEELLVSVDGYGNETVTITMGQFLEIYYGHREWDSMYHTFDWEITEGKDILLMYEGYDSATFIPVGTGVAIVKMRYGYTEEEPDVLTGIPRDNAKSKSYTYSIIIEEAE